MPVHYNHSQREIIKKAGADAGLNVIHIISPSTSAAIHYDLNSPRNEKKEVNVPVVDSGGGACNVSILNVEDKIFEVKPTAGDHLGGEDFDNRMLGHFVKEFKHKYNKDLSSDRTALYRLRSACEQAKRTLSFMPEASIELDSLFEGIDFYSSITRARFEELCDDLFRNILNPVEKALRDANIDKKKVEEIILVGGCSRIPKVQENLSRYFNGKHLNKTVNSDEAAIYGAAIQAAIVSGVKGETLKDLVVLDVIPYTLGITTRGGVKTPIIRVCCIHNFNQNITEKHGDPDEGDSNLHQEGTHGVGPV